MAEEGGIKRFYPIIIMGTLAVAAVVMWKGRATPIKEMPDTAESASPYICTACGHTEEMTPNARANWIREKGQTVKRGGSGDGPVTSVRRQMLTCRACEASTLVLAQKCLKCDKIYGAGQCPVCVAEAPAEPKDKKDKKSRRGGGRR